MIERLFEQQDALVEVKNLSVSFGSQSVLRDINLSIPRAADIWRSIF